MEAFLFGAVLIVALLPLVWSVRQGRLVAATVAAACAFLALIAAVAWSDTTLRQLKSRRQLLEAVPHENQVHGFVSSRSCRSCHPRQYATWHASYHRTMTQLATPQTVAGDFDDVHLTWNGWPCRLYRSGEEFWAELPDPHWVRANPVKMGEPDWLARPPRQQERIVMTTGSHHMQAYWIPSRAGNVLFSFPFSYLLREQRWVPNMTTFLRPDEPVRHDVWNRKCYKCHAVAGQPRLDLRARTMDTRVAELGISCEACHGPAARHVQANRDPARRYFHHLSDEPDPTIVNPRRLSLKRSSQVCGQCHSVSGPRDPRTVLETGHPYRAGDDLDETRLVVRHPKRADQPWRKLILEAQPAYLEQRFWSDGMIRISGREYNGLIESPCYQRGELSCLSCHSMHDSEPDDQLAAGMDGDEACLQCHTEYRKDLESHTHHAPESSGSRCYNCHMPHTTYGLLKAIRSHEIDSPDVAIDLSSGRPNACNLCHLDQTLGWASQHLTKWYGTRPHDLPAAHHSIAAGVLWLLRGDAGQRALAAWHTAWKPARDASGRHWLVPFLAQLLDDPYSAVRIIAWRALREAPGFDDFEYDFLGDASHRLAAPERARRHWERHRPQALERTGPQVLMDETGRLDEPAIQRLLEHRDDRRVDLRE